ncbi:MAG: hypothetical protein ACRDUA_03285 [Micromonosporaceae bacterium]
MTEGIAPVEALRRTPVWRRLIWSYRVVALGGVLLGLGALLAWLRVGNLPGGVCVLAGLFLMPVGGLLGTRSRFALARLRHTYQIEALRRVGLGGGATAGRRWDGSIGYAVVKDFLTMW